MEGGREREMDRESKTPAKAKYLFLKVSTFEEHLTDFRSSSMAFVIFRYSGITGIYYRLYAFLAYQPFHPNFENIRVQECIHFQLYHTFNIC